MQRSLWRLWLLWWDTIWNRETLVFSFSVNNRRGADNLPAYNTFIAKISITCSRSVRQLIAVRCRAVVKLICNSVGWLNTFIRENFREGRHRRCKSKRYLQYRYHWVNTSLDCRMSARAPKVRHDIDMPRFIDEIYLNAWTVRYSES